MDESGNMAMGYSVARDPGVFTGLRYVGREATDTLGVMTTAETTLVDGASAQTFADRWGDYFGMGVDPSDGCTFWFTGMYLPAGGDWRTRFAAFRFDSCGTPTFTTTADNLTQGICAATSTPVALAPISIDVNPRNGFSDPVTMSFVPGLPTGFSGDFSVNPVTPPDTTVAGLSVTNAATPGPNLFTIRGTSGAIERDLEVTVNVATAIAGTPSLTAPANGATNVPAQPTFTWSAATQASSYLIEIATDAAFSNIILSQTVTDTTFQPTAALPLDTQIWWRVSATNDCGSTVSQVFSFFTQPGPGQCGTGTTTEVLFSDNVEGGVNGWTHDAAVGTDSWTISSSRPFDGTKSWKATDPSSISDQRLTSPTVTLPNDLSGLNFQFEQWRLMEGSGTTCADGGILEISLDGGAFSRFRRASSSSAPTRARSRAAAATRSRATRPGAVLRTRTSRSSPISRRMRATMCNCASVSARTTRARAKAGTSMRSRSRAAAPAVCRTASSRTASTARRRNRSHPVTLKASASAGAFFCARNRDESRED